MTKRGYTWTEEYRRECEARRTCKLPAIHLRRAYIAAIEKIRGHEAALQLQQDMLVEWGKK